MEFGLAIIHEKWLKFLQAKPEWLFVLSPVICNIVYLEIVYFLLSQV